MPDLKSRGSTELPGHFWMAVLQELERAETADREDLDATDRMYLVAEGDTLSSIAKRFYGKASSRWRILEANRRVIRDSYFVEPGSLLRIPM